MKKFVWLLGCTTLLLAACDDIDSANSDVSGRYIGNVPEGVLALAGPNQDLSTVRVNPADGCYLYRYAGPVETTFLPLRTADGRPICTKRPEDEAAAS
jgi:hypothetical protein